VEPEKRRGTNVSGIDTTLLEGFSFDCRPDCGLCCFASPRLDRADEDRLRAVVPTARLVMVGGERCIGARENGGACQFLVARRCGVHSARPAPCREYPVLVHVGARLQATVVLSCPGLPLDPVDASSTPRDPRAPRGLDSELASVRERLGPSVERRRTDAERRRGRIRRVLESEGRWVDEEKVRERLARRPLLPSPNEYSPEDLPPVDDGLEFLPIYFDGRAGPVALGQGFGGWEARELSAEGEARPLGVSVAPAQRPALARDAESLLTGYLRYVLARDAFLAAVHLEMVSEPPRLEEDVADRALEDLHRIASDVLARGAVRAKLRGEVGDPLSRHDIELGIRATDQDWLDRPTWGSRL